MSEQTYSRRLAGTATSEQIRGDGQYDGVTAPVVQERIYKLFQEQLVRLHSLPEIARCVTQAIVEAFEVAFCRIWLVQPGDICQAGCIHATADNPALACKDKRQCLHLIASSGIYTHIDGSEHRRVPIGAYKIGMIAAGQEDRFIINDLPSEPKILHQQWASELGLKSFAGYRLMDSDGQTIGVLAMFARRKIEKSEDDFLAAIAASTSYVIQRQTAEDALLAVNAELELRVAQRTAELENANSLLVQEKAQREQAYEQTRAIIENSDVAIWSIDVGHRLLTYNRSFATLMERFNGAIPRIGQTIDQFASVDEAERFILLQDQCLGGAKVRGEMSRQIDGQTRHYEISMSPTRINGHICGAVVFMADITQLKRMIIEVKRSGEEYRNIFDNACVGIFRSTMAGKPLLANRCAATMLGFDSPEEVCREIKNIGIDLYEDPKIRSAILRKMLDTNAAVMNLLTLKRKDGGKIHVNVNMRIVRNAGGEPAFIEGFMEDITPQIRAEETVRRNEEKFRTLFEQSLVGLAMLDADMTLMDANAKFREIFGTDKNLQPGTKIDDLAMIDGKAFSSLEIFDDDAGDLPMEKTLRRNNGGEVDVALLANRIPNPDKTSQFFILLAEDISERKKLQRDLQKVADTERHRLGQEIHDDLGQRLTGITFMAARLQKLMDDGSPIEPDDVKKIVVNLDEATRRARLIGHSMIVPEITSATLSKSIHALAEEYSTVLRIKCHFTGDDVSEQYEDAAATSLYRICQEAISNAIKHGKAGEVNIDLREDAAGLRLIIRDNGSGFTQPKDPAASGRGLYLMQTRAAMIGASLEISSVTGKGTAINCRLPRKATKGNAACPHQPKN